MTEETTKDSGIDALRQARETIERTLAEASIQMTNDKHIIRAYEARIAEMELEIQARHDQHKENTCEQDAELVRANHRIDELEAENQELKRGVDRLIKRTVELVEDKDAAYANIEYLAEKVDRLNRTCGWQRKTIDQHKCEPRYQDAEARAQNVMRLAAAADHHLQHDRVAIARALLTPLIEGKHDAHRYTEAADISGETRPEPDGEDNGGDRPTWRVPEGWDIAHTSTDA